MTSNPPDSVDQAQSQFDHLTAMSIQYEKESKDKDPFQRLIELMKHPDSDLSGKLRAVHRGVGNDQEKFQLYGYLQDMALIMQEYAKIPHVEQAGKQEGPSEAIIEPSKATIEPPKPVVDPSKPAVEPSKPVVEPAQALVELSPKQLAEGIFHALAGPLSGFYVVSIDEMPPVLTTAQLNRVGPLKASEVFGEFLDQHGRIEHGHLDERVSIFDFVNKFSNGLRRGRDAPTLHLCTHYNTVEEKTLSIAPRLQDREFEYEAITRIFLFELSWASEGQPESKEWNPMVHPNPTIQAKCKVAEARLLVPAFLKAKPQWDKILQKLANDTMDKKIQEHLAKPARG